MDLTSTIFAFYHCASGQCCEQEPLTAQDPVLFQIMSFSSE